MERMCVRQRERKNWCWSKNKSGPSISTSNQFQNKFRQAHRSTNSDENWIFSKGVKNKTMTAYITSSSCCSLLANCVFVLCFLASRAVQAPPQLPQQLQLLQHQCQRSKLRPTPSRHPPLPPPLHRVGLPQRQTLRWCRQRRPRMRSCSRGSLPLRMLTRSVCGCTLT